MKFIAIIIYLILSYYFIIGLTNNVSTEMSLLYSDYSASEYADVTKTYSNSKEPLWLTLMNSFQTAMTTTGLALNILTMVTLKFNGRSFKPVIRSLLIHQAFIDMIVCLMAILLIVVPPMALVGNSVLNFIICQAFHSQSLYWCADWISITGLEVIAWERFMAICYPLKHADISKKHLHWMLFRLYPLSPITMCLAFVQVKYKDGQCQPRFYFSSDIFIDLMQGFSIYCLLLLYVIPCVVFFILYGNIVYTLVSRQRQTDLAQSRVIDSATKQLTNTAMVVTGWFIIALGYDCWYYLLGYNHIVVYLKNTPVQKVGIFLAGSNSCVNPIIYAMFMPAYRDSVKRTFCNKQISSRIQRKIPSVSTSIIYY